MTFFGVLKIGPLEPCGNDFQSTGSDRLTADCLYQYSYYYFSAYTWGQKRNSFPQGSSGPIFKIPKNVISYELTEPTFGTFCILSLILTRELSEEKSAKFDRVDHLRPQVQTDAVNQ